MKENGVKFNLNFNCNNKKINQEKYLDIYNKYFTNILSQVDFNSIHNYVDYLLKQEIVQKYNRINGHYVDVVINKRNKKLVKTIK